MIWGSSPQERVLELSAIAEWLSRWSRDKHAWDHDLITLGDFNIERRDDRFHDAFTSTGLTIPADLIQARRSVFDGSGGVDATGGGAAYDQIAWFADTRTSRPLSLVYRAGGSFDFTGQALPSRGLTPTQLSWRISDHLPLWAEFGFALPRAGEQSHATLDRGLGQVGVPEHQAGRAVPGVAVER